MPHVVVVDDEPSILGLTTQWLEAAGYQSRVAADADLALQEVLSAPPGVVVTDLRMPGHDGLWLAEQVRIASPDTAVVVATGSSDLPSAVSSLRLGVLDYLVKPFSCEELQAAVQRGMLWHAARTSSRVLTDSLDREAHQRDRGMTDAPTAEQITAEGTLDAMVAMMQMWNRPLADHAHRVAVMSVRLAEKLDMPKSDRADLHRAALLHEVAVVALPEELLAATQALPPEQQWILDSAPVLAREWLTSLPLMAGAAAIVGSIGEWFDGSGRPEGRVATDIPIGSRILAVADAFDELRRPRPEAHSAHQVRSVRDTLVELSRERGSRFDPNVMDALVKQQTVN